MVGLARYTEAMKKHLSIAGVDHTLIYPQYPLPVAFSHRLLKPFGYNVHDFFNIFPVSAKFSEESVKHFSHQMMASLFTFKPNLKKVVITVHDIVPYLMRDDPHQNQYRRFYDRHMDEFAMNNIRKADRIIAISEFTGQMLVKHLGCPQDKIQIVLYGLDHEVFYPMKPSEAFRNKYGLSEEKQYLLYVGSENPRKNLPRFFQAFGEARRSLPNLQLVKIGPPDHPGQYALLQDMIHNLKIQDAVLWINHISNHDLVTFYTFADAFVFPSLYEGFGMPPLEAMACGTPVICSNSASLPEVTGDAALQVDPEDVAGWTHAIIKVIEDQSLQQDLITRGLARAAQFTWEKTVRETIEVYQEVEQIYTR